MTPATAVTAEAPSPASWRSTHPRAGLTAPRIAPPAPVTIMTGRTGSTTALAIGPAIEITPNVPAMIGVVASCAATDGERLDDQPRSRDSRGDRSREQEDPRGAEKGQLEARVVDQVRPDTEQDRRGQRQHGNGVSATGPRGREHRRAGHECAPNRGRAR